MEKLNVKEFAELAKVTPYTVRKWIKDGIINAEKVSTKGRAKAWEIDRQELAKVKQ